MKNLLPGDGELYYIPNFISQQETKELFEKLLQEVKWEQKNIIIYDKSVPIPRLTAWFGPEGQNYLYSGILNQVQPWVPEILHLKSKIETQLDIFSF